MPVESKPPADRQRKAERRADSPRRRSRTPRKGEEQRLGKGDRRKKGSPRHASDPRSRSSQRRDDTSRRAPRSPSISQVCYLCEAHEKILLVMAILMQDKPRNSVVYCNSDECEKFVFDYLKKRGFPVSAKDSKGSRTNRRVSVVCDRLLRDPIGKEFDFVINFDTPYTVRGYAMRLETIKPASHSRCVSLLCDYYSDFAQPILTKYKLKGEWPKYDISDRRYPNQEEVEAWAKEKPPRSAEKNKKPRKANKAKPITTEDLVLVDDKNELEPRIRSIWEKILSFFAK